MAKIRKFAAFILFSAFFSLSAGRSYAQSSYYEEDNRTFYGGLLAGTNLTQVDGDNYAGYHKAGLNVGGIVYMPLGGNFATTLEILYSQKGARGNKPQKTNSQNLNIFIREYNIQLNYAEVPIQILYFDKRRFHAGGGISYSQLINSNEIAETDNNAAVNIGNLNEDFPFKKYDLNFLLGGSVHIVKGLFFNARFQYSILPVRKKTHPELGRPEQYNNIWTLRLMYLFGV